MSITPTYKECIVPETLSPFFSRILHLQYDESTPAVIPVSPTGRMYLGWVPEGCASAFANGEYYELSCGQAHISGQLTVFDVEYTLNSGLTHYLAEFTPLGAYQLIGKDVSYYTNKCEIFTPAIKGPINLHTFEQFLLGYTSNVSSIDNKIINAITMIDGANGDINISALAESLGLSARHFRREFIKHLGLAPKPYAIIKKVLFALKLLADKPNSNLSDIVHSAGFYDQAHLTRVFQLYLRTSPKQLHLDEDGVLRSIVAGS